MPDNVSVLLTRREFRLACRQAEKALGIVLDSVSADRFNLDRHSRGVLRGSSLRPSRLRMTRRHGESLPRT
jgi:hypothetical protein